MEKKNIAKEEKKCKRGDKKIPNLEPKNDRFKKKSYCLGTRHTQC